MLQFFFSLLRFFFFLSVFSISRISNLITDVSRPVVAAYGARCDDAEEAHESRHTHREGLAVCFRLEGRHGEDVETRHEVEVEAGIVAAAGMENTQAAY